VDLEIDPETKFFQDARSLNKTTLRTNAIALPPIVNDLEDAT
jgi:hypothetical protein